eukprot:2563375-Amphidinium_carterae.1
MVVNIEMKCSKTKYDVVLLCSQTQTETLFKPKGSIGHAFTVRIQTENQNQTNFSLVSQHAVSVLIELMLQHLRYRLTDVPPRPNPTPGNETLNPKSTHRTGQNGIEDVIFTLRVVVFQDHQSSRIRYTS